MPPQIRNPQQLELAPQAKVILAEMFPGYEQVILHDDLVSLGYSGSWVYRVHLLTGRDHPELPLVVKIAPADLIAREALAYQQCVRNQWPGIAELRGQPVYLPEANLGALCYPLMGGGVFKMKSLREYCLQASTEDVCFVLRERLFQIMQERILRPAYNAFEHPLRASYDRILPVNLVVEPGHTRQTQRTAPTLITPDTALGPSLQPGAPVCLDGFIITEVNLQQRSVTLNVPADRADNAFRLRIQPVDDPSAYRIDQVMPPTEGTVRKTRESGLHAELAAAFGDAFDPACATVTLPGAAGNRRTVLPNPLLALPKILDTR